MTFEQRKQKVIKDIQDLKNEELLTQLETIIDSGNDSFESELAELLRLSSKSSILIAHQSAKNLIR